MPRIPQLSCRQMLKAVIFDFGQTIMPETLSIRQDCPVELMPGITEAMSQIMLPKGIWANTKEATASQIRSWLKRAGLDAYIQWVVTSFEIGHRKPSLEFFTSAQRECGLRASEIVFVGNQLNTDILGANNAGIRSVYLADARYRSADDLPETQIIPAYTIETLFDLPRLIQSLD
jgi:FMN phosphatase YigB (HAD superfamily)